MKKIILASSSPRRKELLSLLNIDFTIQSADIDESVIVGEEPTDYVLRLAEEKAEKIATSNPDSYVLGSDTVVFKDNRFFGKPKDRADAKDMLTELSGSTHEVYTGHALICKAEHFMEATFTKTEISFREISATEIEEYLDTDEPFDKAGAYALQGIAAKFIGQITGPYTGVIGLDLVIVKELLFSAELCQ